MAEQQEKASKASKASARRAAGTWVVVDDSGAALAVLNVERSEVRAWRLAGRVQAIAVWWPFGSGLEALRRIVAEYRAEQVG